MEWRLPRPRRVVGRRTTEGQDPSMMIQTLSVRRNIQLVLTGLIMTVRNQDELADRERDDPRGADWRRGTCIHMRIEELRDRPVPRRSISSGPFRVGRSRTGLGLFATEAIKKGTFIVEYWGKRIPSKKADELETKYLFEINSRWTIDGSNRKNIARYINHSCRPNAEAHIVKGTIKIRALKTIKPGDEIAYNYGRGYFDTFIKPLGCKCLACCGKKRRRRS